MDDSARDPSQDVVADSNGRKNATHGNLLKRAACKAEFLRAYAKCRKVSKAARHIGRSRETIYRWRREDLRFRERWDAIDATFPAELEATARSLAVYGVLEPVFQQGRRVGRRRRWFPKLIMELLRAEHPEKYGRALLPAPEQTNDPDAAAAKVRARLAQMQASIGDPPATEPVAQPDGTASTPPPDAAATEQTDDATESA